MTESQVREAQVREALELETLSRFRTAVMESAYRDAIRFGSRSNGHELTVVTVHRGHSARLVYVGMQLTERRFWTRELSHEEMMEELGRVPEEAAVERRPVALAA